MVFTYELMRNHWHFVVHPASKQDLSEFFQFLSGTHTNRVHAVRNSAGEGHVAQLAKTQSDVVSVVVVSVVSRRFQTSFPDVVSVVSVVSRIVVEGEVDTFRLPGEREETYDLDQSEAVSKPNDTGSAQRRATPASNALSRAEQWRTTWNLCLLRPTGQLRTNPRPIRTNGD